MKWMALIGLIVLIPTLEGEDDPVEPVWTTSSLKVHGAISPRSLRLDRFAETAFSRCKRSKKAGKGFGIIIARKASLRQYPKLSFRYSPYEPMEVFREIAEETNMSLSVKGDLITFSSEALQEHHSHFSFLADGPELAAIWKKEAGALRKDFNKVETVYRDDASGRFFLGGNRKEMTKFFGYFSSMNATLVTPVMRCRFACIRVKESALDVLGPLATKDLAKMTRKEWDTLMHNESVRVVAEGYHYLKGGTWWNLTVRRQRPAEVGDFFDGELPYLTAGSFELQAAPSCHGVPQGKIDLDMAVRVSGGGKTHPLARCRGKVSFTAGMTYVFERRRCTDSAGASCIDLKLLAMDSDDLKKWSFPDVMTRANTCDTMVDRVLSQISAADRDKVKALLSTPVSISGNGLSAFRRGVNKSTKKIRISLHTKVEKVRMATYYVHRKPLRELLTVLERLYPRLMVKAELKWNILYLTFQDAFPNVVTKRFIVHPPKSGLPPGKTSFFAENLDKLGVPFPKGCSFAYDRETKRLSITHSPWYMPVFKRWIEDYHLSNFGYKTPTAVRIVQVETATLKQAMLADPDIVTATLKLVKGGKAKIIRTVETKDLRTKPDNDSTSSTADGKWTFPDGRTVVAYDLDSNGCTYSQSIQLDNQFWDKSGRRLLECDINLAHSRVTVPGAKDRPWPQEIRSLSGNFFLQAYPGKETVMTRLRTTEWESKKDVTLLVLVKAGLLGADGREDWELPDRKPGGQRSR